MVTIITKSGHDMTLEAWQKYYGLQVGSNKIGNYFSIDEPVFSACIRDYGQLVVNEMLMRLLDRFRVLIGKPVRINSFNRNEAKQIELRKKGLRAATVSPHVVYMAADIDTNNKEETETYVRVLKQAAKDLGYSIRIGYKQYLEAGSSFVHVDVCPEYYGPGKPFAARPHPPVWEKSITW